ncbi:MAG: ATP-binding protein [Nitrospirota bacterium]|jgi:two-component system NtrC family sensor kinase
MKIKRKIIFSNVFNIALIALIGALAVQYLNTVNTKLRFVEIADDLNVSFLEMRLSEKNYFLYEDPNALADLESNIMETMKALRSVKGDIVRAIGESQFDELRGHLVNYAREVERVKGFASTSDASAKAVRAKGHELEAFADRITHLERGHINEIILKSKRILYYLFLGILLSALVVSRSVSRKILEPIREIEALTKSISAGTFTKIDMVPPKDELGSVIGAINTMSEKLKTREEEIIQSKKLASMGILVAGVAHELNNPLNNISMIAQAYSEVYKNLSDEERMELMGRVEAETERIRDIVRNLLDFSKPKAPNLKKSGINDVLRHTLKLVQNMLDISNINTRIVYGKRLPEVCVDEDQIQQVLVNLIINAIQSMSSGGDLSITTRQGEAGRTVEIEIRDTGKGVPPEFLSHIFDPFFTTKEQGGTGLGLWVSYGIIKNHNGNIKVESTVGQGTVFTVELPIYENEGV